MIRVHQIPPQLLEDFWPSAGPMLEQSLAYHPFMDIEDLFTICLRGRAHLLVVMDDMQLAGAIVMEAVQYPKTKVGHVIALAGGSNSLAKYSDVVEARMLEWCASQGCDKIGMLGRPGWARVLGKRGWHEMPFMAAWKEVAEQWVSHPVPLHRQ